MIHAYFDTRAFMAALDGIRTQRKATWYHVWHETGVQLNTLKKMRQGQAECSIHTLTALGLWSGLELTPFMKQYE